MRQSVVRWAPVLLALGPSACGGGGGGGGGVTPSYEVFVDPAETPTTSSVADLFGVATCDACPPSETLFGTCPPVEGPFTSGIGITWRNLTTGESGDAVHGIYGRQSWFFSYCTVSYSHRWFASVPLAFGPNVIEITASGPDRNAGTDEVLMTRLPAAPGNVVAQAGRTDVTLSWDAVAGAESYDLLWSGEPDLSLPATQVIEGVTSPFAHPGPADAARYYAVRATAAGYDGPRSEVVFATVGWVPEAIPLPPMVSTGVDLALAVDSTGHAHVHVSRLGTVTDPRIRNDYATNATGAWTSSVVSDTTDLAADLALDAEDTVHVSYIDGPGEHAIEVWDTWVAEDFDADASCYTSLALDPQGKAHVLYQQNRFTPALTGLVRYATNASGAWTGETVDATKFGCYQEGSKLSLALDGGGHAHALYLAGPTGEGLRYATDATGAWVPETVTPGYVRSLALALDASGTPHAAWTDETNTLVHAERRGPGDWVAEPVDAYAFGPSLAIEPGGDVHVSYLQYPLGQLRHATLAAGVWRVQPVAAASWGTTSIALDAQGFVHVVWVDGDVRYVTDR